MPDHLKVTTDSRWSWVPWPAPASCSLLRQWSLWPMALSGWPPPSGWFPATVWGVLGSWWSWNLTDLFSPFSFSLLFFLSHSPVPSPFPSLSYSTFHFIFSLPLFRLIFSPPFHFCSRFLFSFLLFHSVMAWPGLLCWVIFLAFMVCFSPGLCSTRLNLKRLRSGVVPCSVLLPHLFHPGSDDKNCRVSPRSPCL